MAIFDQYIPIISLYLGNGTRLNSLTDSNFMIRQLFKDCYWLRFCTCMYSVLRFLFFSMSGCCSMSDILINEYVYACKIDTMRWRLIRSRTWSRSVEWQPFSVTSVTSNYCKSPHFLNFASPFLSSEMRYASWPWQVPAYRWQTAHMKVFLKGAWLASGDVFNTIDR